MLEKLFDIAPCGFFTFFDDNTVLHVNETLCRILGYQKSDIEGENVEKIFTISTRIFFQTHFFPLVKMHGHVEEIFITLLAKGGVHLPVLMNADRIDLDGRKVTSCALIVVPNRKKYEDELVASRNAAELALKENSHLIKVQSDLQEHAENLEAQMQLVRRQNHELQQFSHVVTHNLKEPLRKILLFIGKIQEAYKPGLIEKLVKSGEQMKSVVTGLQEYVWLNQKLNAFKPVDLSIVAASAARKLELIEPGVLMLTHDHLPVLTGDEEQLELFFYQVFSNAIKFKREEKATVHISTTILKRNKFEKVAGKYKYEDFARIEIKDEGIGFDKMYNEHVFELFRKLNYAEGQGVGLSLCKKIAANHSGYVEADSKINMYTNIILWLPVNQPGVQDVLTT